MSVVDDQDRTVLIAQASDHGIRRPRCDQIAGAVDGEAVLYEEIADAVGDAFVG